MQFGCDTIGQRVLSTLLTGPFIRHDSRRNALDRPHCDAFQELRSDCYPLLHYLPFSHSNAPKQSDTYGPSMLLTITARCVAIFLTLIGSMQLVHCHRSDVYIAGFFPYGNGKENSETGELEWFLCVFCFSLSCAVQEYTAQLPGVGQCALVSLGRRRDFDYAAQQPIRLLSIIQWQYFL